MSTAKFYNKYRISSSRALWHGYDGGVYFVTICTQNREHYFGEIVVGDCINGTGNCCINGTQYCRDVARRVSTKTGMGIGMKTSSETVVGTGTNGTRYCGKNVVGNCCINGTRYCRDVARRVSTKTGMGMEMETLSGTGMETGTEIETLSETASSVAEQPKMQLSEIGIIATENFANVTLHYPYAEIPLFVVMPNHIHAVVMIDGAKTPRRDIVQMRHDDIVQTCDMEQTRDIVETWRAASLQKREWEQERKHEQEQSERMKNIANMQGCLSVVIGGLKSAITKSVHTNNIPFAWQPRFYDHIVRNQGELNRIAEYIENNIAKWGFDEMNINN